MFLFNLIALVIIFLGFRNLKQGFLWLLIFKIFLVQNISLINVPGLPLLTMDVALTLVYVFLFFYRRESLDINYVPFPYKTPFILLAISWTLSAIFSAIGITGAASQLLKDICQSLITVWMMWELIEDEEDYSFLLKGFTAAFLVAALYAYFEKSIGSNPLQDYYISLMGDTDKTVNFQYLNDVRGQRIQSVFEHPIGSGINFAMYVLLAISSLYLYKVEVSNKHVVLLTSILSIPCVLMSNSRGPIVFLCLGLLMFVSLKDTKTYKILIGGIIVFAILMPILGEYADIVLSIFDSSAQDKVGGSNSEQRIDQLIASIAVASSSPILGLGQKFQNVLNSYYIEALLGMESMWFYIITTFGALGVIVNIISAYYALYKVPVLYQSRSLFFVALAYWITGSLTSLPGILEYMYYLLLIYFIKQSNVYQQMRYNICDNS